MVTTRYDTYRYERRRYDYLRYDMGSYCKNTNKRAQRALGRSPEEKFKGHNNREPQGHNLNNFGRGHFDDVIY